MSGVTLGIKSDDCGEDNVYLDAFRFSHKPSRYQHDDIYGNTDKKGP